MAKSPKNSDANADAGSEPEDLSQVIVTDTITYLPGPMDPPVTKWRGIVVHANVPKEVRAPQEHFDHARGNKFFQVGSDPVKRTRPGAPKTAREYLAYFAEWLKSENFDTAEGLIVRFTKDRGLQDTCEVGADDFTFMSSLFNPRLHELAKADALTDPQIAALWASHGVNQLPW